MADSSNSTQWIEDAILKQLINCFDCSEFSDSEKIGDSSKFSPIVKSEWKSCGLTVALKSLKFDAEEKEAKQFVKE
ncbi:13640_t:CDS:1, partial [Racocetra fulgida]